MVIAYNKGKREIQIPGEDELVHGLGIFVKRLRAGEQTQVTDEEASKIKKMYGAEFEFIPKDFDKKPAAQARK